MAGNLVVLPRQQSGGEAFSEAFQPYLQMAMQAYMKKKEEERQKKTAYEEAEKMGLINPYQEVPTQNGTANIAPLRGIDLPKQYQLNEQPGFKTSLKLEGGIPTFSRETKEKDYTQDYYKAAAEKLRGGNAGGLGIPGSQEEAIQQVLGQNPDAVAGDVEVKPVYNNVKGIKQLTGYEASVSSQKQKARISKEETTKSNLKQSEMIKSIAKKKLESIYELEKNLNYFGGTGYAHFIPRTKAKYWKANLDQIVSSEIVGLITEMKGASKTGATGFGQLSEREGQILLTAASRLSIGLHPADAKKELDKMKPLLEKIVVGGQMGQGIEDDPLGLR